MLGPLGVGQGIFKKKKRKPKFHSVQFELLLNLLKNENFVLTFV